MYIAKVPSFHKKNISITKLTLILYQVLLVAKCALLLPANERALIKVAMEKEVHELEGQGMKNNMQEATWKSACWIGGSLKTVLKAGQPLLTTIHVPSPMPSCQACSSLLSFFHTHHLLLHPIKYPPLPVCSSCSTYTCSQCITLALMFTCTRVRGCTIFVHFLIRPAWHLETAYAFKVSNWALNCSANS